MSDVEENEIITREETQEENFLARMNAMQKRLDQFSLAQGIPIDPVDAHVQAIKAHVKVQSAAHPSHDFTDLVQALDKIPAEGVTTDHTALLKETVADYLELNATVANDLSYVWQLARELHKMLLKAAV
jgi:hypothetical protein